MEDLLGFERIGEEGDFIRFKSYADIGNTIDIKTASSVKGRNNVGTGSTLNPFTSEKREAYYSK